MQRSGWEVEEIYSGAPSYHREHNICGVSQDSNWKSGIRGGWDGQAPLVSEKQKGGRIPKRTFKVS